MSRFDQKLNVANFTCRFGEKLVLLDLYDEVVSPAFFNSGKSRAYGESEYFLHGVENILLEGKEFAIAGRIVKETIVSRDQVFKEGKIVPDHQEMESAPSSFFLLILSNHKLLYVRENQGAPGLSAFSATMSFFLKESYRKWLRGIYEARKEEGEKTPWRDLYSEFPRPNLEIVPLANAASVSAYVEKFRTINSVEIRLLNTNHEIDNSALFGKMRSIKNDIGSENISLKAQKSGETGLDKGAVGKLIAKQAEEANSRITLRGKDIAGDNFTAQNENFNVSIPVGDVPVDVTKAAGKLYAKLQHQVALGVFSLAKAPAKSVDIVKRLVSEIDWI